MQFLSVYSAFFSFERYNRTTVFHQSVQKVSIFVFWLFKNIQLQIEWSICSVKFSTFPYFIRCRCYEMKLKCLVEKVKTYRVFFLKHFVDVSFIW